MKKLLMLTVPLLLLAFYVTSPVTTAQGNCAPQEGPMPVCQDGSRININNISKRISPRNLCIDAGETVTFNVTPNGTTATVEGKNGGWPNGSGTSFEVVVPGDAPFYEYNVYFEDNSCIDPRITVKTD